MPREEAGRNENAAGRELAGAMPRFKPIPAISSPSPGRPDPLTAPLTRPPRVVRGKDGWPRCRVRSARRPGRLEVEDDVPPAVAGVSEGKSAASLVVPDVARQMPNTNSRLLLYWDWG